MQQASAVKSETVSVGYVEDVKDGRNAKPTFDVEKVEAAEHSQHAELEVVQGPQKWTFKAVVAMFGLSLVFPGTTCQTPLFCIASSLAYIVPDIGSPDKSTWLPVAFTLASGTPLPFAGYIQDIFGRRWMALLAILTNILGAIIMGTAHSFGQMVTGAAIAGCGAGTCELSALAGVSEVVPVKHRGYINGIILFVTLPFGTYNIFGQLVATGLSWRWGMWLSSILQGVGFFFVLFSYFPTKHSRMNGLNNREMVKNIDWVGGAVFTTGLTLFLVGCQSGGYTHPWTSAYVLCTLIIGISLLIAFVIWEIYVPSYPLAPAEIFRIRAIVMGLCVAFVGGMFYYSISNFGPIYFSRVYTTKPITIGTRSTIFLICDLSGGIILNFLISRFPRHVPWILASSCALTMLGCGLLIMGSPENPNSVVAFAALAGLGVGGLVIAVATVCLIASPSHLMATTAALTLAARIFGGTIGYAIYSNIFTNKLTTNIPTLVGRYAVEAGLPLASVADFLAAFLATPMNTSALASIPGVSSQVLAAAELGSRWAFAESLKWVFVASLPFGGLALLAALGLGDVEKYMSDKVVAHLHAGKVGLI